MLVWIYNGMTIKNKTHTHTHTDTEISSKHCELLKVRTIECNNIKE